MKIGIFHEMMAIKPGGAEAVAAAIAETLLRQHEVTLVHSRPHADVAAWEGLFGAELGGLRTRVVPAATSRGILWRQVSEQRYGHRTTEGFDMVVASVHNPPPFSVAPRGALYVHFPSPRFPPSESAGSLRDLRRVASQLRWQRRMSKYQVIMGNSGFTASHVLSRWGVTAQVVHPPISPVPALQPKRQLIISVGRLAPGASGKRQKELMAAYARLLLPPGGEWRYVQAGAMGDLDHHHAYLRQVRELMVQGTEVHTNAPRKLLDELYATASIFWHGAGWGESDRQPERMEHFGIATAEAMASGCVPVVHACGGQPEIVEHGKNGFLWRNESELLDYTRQLILQPEMLARMSAAAKERGKRFSRTRFSANLLAALDPLLSSPQGS